MERLFVSLLPTIISAAVLILSGGNGYAAESARYDVQMESSVTKDGITWTFSQPVPVGRFVNGDYYVVGPVTIVNIDPYPTPEEEGRHGSVLNMPGNNSSISPFDYRVSSNRYRPQYRVYPPIDMEPGDILVSSISIGERGDFPAWMRERYETPSSYTQSVSVLTCLEEAVSPDAFRPAYVDRTQRIYHADNLRRDLLPNLEKVGNLPDIDTFAWHFSRPWLEVCFFGFDAAVEYQAVYGREVGRAVGMATLLLMLDYTAEEKEELLINIVQYAIDLWGLARAGYPGWPAHGGHGSGRKWPIIFAGILLDDEEMKSPSETFPDLRFGEDMHTGYDDCWTGADVVYTGHQGLWMGEPVSSSLHWGPYEHLQPSEWRRTFNNVNNWNIGENYRRCCTSIAWVGQALAARIMRAERLWNHDAFFDYVDRWMREDDTEHIQIMIETAGIDYSANWQRQGQAWDRFVENMWHEYRENLQTTVIDDDLNRPENFYLSQNYPNPFNAGTVINYRLNESGHVMLSIYDILGRLVITLVDEVKPAGAYSVRWDGTGSTGLKTGSGVYLYKLQGSSGPVDTKKMILLQ